MKCPQCGGSLAFKDGSYLCEGCGTTFAQNSVFENIDVCICYKESDDAGRRTRDSIVAQEVYSKLEGKGITTYYERISADGLVEKDLESSNLEAVYRAKVILALGASVESFSFIEEMYGKYFSEKLVVPFCVDVLPGDIPKTLSKIQATNYSAIGWDKDLIKGIYHLLGRESELDAVALYNRRQKRILIGVLAVSIMVLLTAVVAWLWFGPVKPGGLLSGDKGVEPTKPLTQNEIFDQAYSLLESGKYAEALKMFSQIPDHANSTKMIQRIYSQYDGFYENGTIMFHLEITDGVRAEIELRVQSDEAVSIVKEIAQISIDTIECEYVDNHKNSGIISVQLTDTGINLKQTNASGAQIFESSFQLTEKADQAIAGIDRNLLLEWLESGAFCNQLEEWGYTLVEESDLGYYNACFLYRIEYTDIYLSVSNGIAASIAAPAEIIAPFLIGEEGEPTFVDEYLYWPGSHMDIDNMYMVVEFGECDRTVISADTCIGITSVDLLDGIGGVVTAEWAWDVLMARVSRMDAENAMRERYALDEEIEVSAYTIAVNNTHHLMAVQTESMAEEKVCAWYKGVKGSHSVEFLREGPCEFDSWDDTFSEEIWYAYYQDFAEEYEFKSLQYAFVG